MNKPTEEKWNLAFVLVNSGTIQSTYKLVQATALVGNRELFTYTRLLENMARKSSSTWDWPLQHQDGIVNIKNDTNVFQADLEVPSFKASEIEVRVVNEELVIRCSKESSTAASSLSRAREIQRSYKLPSDVDLRTIKTTMKSDGKLHISAMKKQP